MKLVITIPAYNEESTIGNVIENIPRNIAKEVQVLIVDDGSTDDTIGQAKKAGADKIMTLKTHRGLAAAFKRALEWALDMGADIIVNIDADGQYDPCEIPQLIKPIVSGDADIVLGSRFKGSIEYMPRGKKVGNILATKITSLLTGLSLSDAQTGFRAFSKEAALRLNVVSEYTYTQETIIQTANKGLRITEVPCTFKKRIEGRSRLISNILSYAKKAGITILRTYMNFRPLRTFFVIGGTLFLLGIILGFRILIHFLYTGNVSPYIPSAILTAILLIVGFQIIILGLIADMIGTVRKVMEEALYDLKKKRTIRKN